MKIIEVRKFLQEQNLRYHRVAGSRYEIIAAEEVLFTLDIEHLRDAKQARERIAQKFEYVCEVATRRWQ